MKRDDVAYKVKGSSTFKVAG